jgi:hypothetical protein
MSDFDIMAAAALKQATKRTPKHQLTEGYRYLVRTSDDVMYCWYENSVFIDEQGYTVTPESWRFIPTANLSREQLEAARDKTTPEPVYERQEDSPIYTDAKYKGD